MSNLSKYLISQNVSVLNMMFHSNELMPKGSKYNSSIEEVDLYLKKLDDYFAFINSNFTVQFVTLKEMYSLIKNNRKDTISKTELFQK